MKRLLTVIAGLVVAACQSDRSVASHPGRLAADISDGAHQADCTTATATCVPSNLHFFFLPPMVKAPTTTGVFNPNLAPSVTICPVVANVCVGASFSPGPVQVDAVGQQYKVNWNTDPTTISTTAIYRLVVTSSGLELGFADVQPVSNGSQLKNIETGEFIGLVDGRTLPIKFRIEQGAVCFGRTDCVEQTVGPATTEQHVIVPSGFAAASFPPGYFNQTVTLTIFEVPTSCFGSSTPPLGFKQFGCFNFSTEPKAADVLGCVADPANPAKCARVEVCPTITPDDQRYGHLVLFRSDPGAPAREIPEAHEQFIHCPTTTIGLGPTGLGDVADAAWHAVGRAVGRLIQPPPLFAASAMIHNGLGGLSCCFSNFGWALPLTLSTVPGTDHNTATTGTQVVPDPAVLLQYLHPTPSPAPGFAVNFAAILGTGASLSAPAATTDVNGNASVHWTLGSTGVNAIVATTDSASGSPDTLTATATPPPDLLISTTLTANPLVVAPGGHVQISAWTVTNQGGDLHSPTGTIRNGFYLSTDTTITTSDVFLDANFNTNDVLGAGQSFQWGAPTLTIPANTVPGTYYIGILVDDLNQAADANVSNNFQSVKITVVTPGPG